MCGNASGRDNVEILKTTHSLCLKKVGIDFDLVRQVRLSGSACTITQKEERPLLRRIAGA